MGNWIMLVLAALLGGYYLLDAKYITQDTFYLAVLPGIALLALWGAMQRTIDRS